MPEFWDAITPALAQALAAVTIAVLGWIAVLANQALAAFKEKTNIDLGAVKLEMDTKHRAAIKEAAETFVRSLSDGLTPDDLEAGREYIKRTMPEAIQWHAPSDGVLDQILTAKAGA